MDRSQDLVKTKSHTTPPYMWGWEKGFDNTKSIYDCLHYSNQKHCDHIASYVKEMAPDPKDPCTASWLGPGRYPGPAGSADQCLRLHMGAAEKWRKKNLPKPEHQTYPQPLYLPGNVGNPVIVNNPLLSLFAGWNKCTARMWGMTKRNVVEMMW